MSIENGAFAWYYIDTERKTTKTKINTKHKEENIMVFSWICIGATIVVAGAAIYASYKLIIRT